MPGLQQLQATGIRVNPASERRPPVRIISATLFRFSQAPARCAFYGDLYPNEECYDAKVSEGLKALLRARKKFAYGAQREYPHEKNCIGFVREGDGSHAGCVVLVSNADDVDG